MAVAARVSKRNMEAVGFAEIMSLSLAASYLTGTRGGYMSRTCLDAALARSTIWAPAQAKAAEWRAKRKS